MLIRVDLCWYSCIRIDLILFHKPSTKDDIPYNDIPELVIGTKLIKRKRYINFLHVMIDKCITWKNHIRTVENKIAKKYRIIISSQTITQCKFL